MLDLQHQYNNYTTIPHMRVSFTYWGPPSCEELLYNCCIGVVQESNLGSYIDKFPVKYYNKRHHNSLTPTRTEFLGSFDIIIHLILFVLESAENGCYVWKVAYMDFHHKNEEV
jgi:hypothetical protein